MNLICKTICLIARTSSMQISIEFNNKKKESWRVFHRQAEFSYVMVSDCKNLLAILFVARALNQSKSNWFNFLICKKNVLWTEQREHFYHLFSFLFFFVFFSLTTCLFCSIHPTPSHFLPYTTLPGTDIIFPFHSNNLSFSIFRLLDLTFFLLFTSSIRVLHFWFNFSLVLLPLYTDAMLLLLFLNSTTDSHRIDTFFHFALCHIFNIQNSNRKQIVPLSRVIFHIGIVPVS